MILPASTILMSAGSFFTDMFIFFIHKYEKYRVTKTFPIRIKVTE